MLQFLEESKVVPASALTGMREELSLPHAAGASEYRLYFGARQVEQEQTVGDEVQMVEVTEYDYVSVLADHEPTDDEWKEVLMERGYTKTKAASIVRG